MPSYHPSQQIASCHHQRYSQAILSSLTNSAPMLVTLPDCEHFSPCRISQPSAKLTLNFQQKLGHLYEDALGALLDHCPHHDVIARNLQIRDAHKRTLGELDFLIHDKQTDSHLHLELAVKFYLAHPREGAIMFPGPDARDNYQRKLNRLLTHQLRLSQHESTRERLASKYQITSVTPAHLIHGIFFEPIDQAPVTPPEHANPDCRRRKWLHCHAFPEHFDPSQELRVVPKPLWLCEITPALYETLVSVTAAELIELGQQRCTMFLTQPELEPHFIAPDSWPNH